MGIKKIVLAGALGVAALAGTNLPGLEVTKASAASIESNISTIEGRVVEISDNVIFVESKQYTDPISINFDSIPNVKIGDQVKVTGTMMRNFTEYMIANSIENKSLTPGMHLKENGRPDYVIGEVSKKGKIDEYVNVPIDYVLVKYPKINGGDEILEVYLTQGQKLNVGDKVKVNNMEFAQWGGSSINWNIENNIEKIQESKTSNQNNDDQWIWS
ncbi:MULTISPECIES: ATP F0F1 synthase subunit alpha [Bacillus cereus group]|uniref:ATP F0F1 synthase subunit alpha n=2 Tax=Bacillus cereus group TaxID=86661 RepID=A0A2C1CN96_BACCE|nr:MULTISPECIES: ATP F0F1 synthase subunit alpha [Bacillus cereus group]OFD68807.1 F0F1 ATP synthase subunit alpha [Bacillus mycoides]OFD83294.1 F0F1 ATP synthase subunit alpha [Bacillus mycoides]OFD85843.1 F0F1 ATP synthase subunit alpha [Bacillus mycoides]PGS89197.1 ATP F0F1 synthase subunit alpha [Bacillus cereus]